MLKKPTPPTNSYNEITEGMYILVYFALITVKRADKKAEVNAKTIPKT